MPQGLGGPGAGQIEGPGLYPGLQDLLNMNRAGGFGLGVYGYPLAYGITPWGQQARMLNNQWPGIVGEINDGPVRNLPAWFTFGSGRAGP